MRLLVENIKKRIGTERFVWKNKFSFICSTIGLTFGHETIKLI